MSNLGDVEVEHALGLHQYTIPPMIREEEIHDTVITEEIHDNVEIHDLLPAAQSTAVELEDNEDELANDQMFDEFKETSLQDSLTSLQDSPLNKVMVTRDSRVKLNLYPL